MAKLRELTLGRTAAFAQIVLLTCAMWTPSEAQVASAVSFAFESVAVATPKPLNGGAQLYHEAGSRRPVLWGALVGAGIGLLGGAIAYGFCTNDDTGNNDSCAGKAALVFGLNTGLGALVGLILSGDAPAPGLAFPKLLHNKQMELSAPDLCAAGVPPHANGLMVAAHPPPPSLQLICGTLCRFCS